MKQLVSLKLNKKDRKEEKAKFSDPFYGSEFPWGTRVELDDNALEKMGLKVGDFSVGEEVRMMAKCVVIAVQQRKDTDGRVELQIESCFLGVKDDVDKAFEEVSKDKASK